MPDHAVVVDAPGEEERVARWRGAVGRTASLAGPQRELLMLVARGYTNADIARRVFLSERTVGDRLRHLARELGLESRDELVHRRRVHPPSGRRWAHAPPAPPAGAKRCPGRVSRGYVPSLPGRAATYWQRSPSSLVEQAFEMPLGSPVSISYFSEVHAGYE
ncbi:response regulator transcription factor [Streptomyces sp. NPDC088755]|uniref:response regulator transcription factor n=1 Tax=Streptomyces sp. NPDC088755 TaxID=3365888 RepID=UPI003800371A